MYKRLLRFTPGENVLHFDVIGALAYDEDEDLDEQRAQELLGVFLADKDDLLPQISFVQSCDYVYKHLRFLRAAINNSSKIDSVLEDVFDCIFYGALTILIMTLLGFNPWPLLVSFSTVMVSFAFAFGPSAAKWIEGTLMIAVRRPYGKTEGTFFVMPRFSTNFGCICLTFTEPFLLKTLVIESQLILLRICRCLLIATLGWW